MKHGKRYRAAADLARQAGALQNLAAAVKLVVEAPGKDLQHQDSDEWWRVRRVLARRLIDLGRAQTAYRVASEAAPPANPYYRAEFHFLAGWIALRFLADPIKAVKHFAHIDDGSADPIVLARAAYWRGRWWPRSTFPASTAPMSTGSQSAPTTRKAPASGRRGG